MGSTAVGVLIDFGFSEAVQKFILDGYRLAFDEALEDGILDRPVELKVEIAEGLPTGSTRNVLDAWKRLDAQGVVAVMGPLISENAVDIREYIDTVGHIPTIAWGGSDGIYGEWTFALSNGSLPEEPCLMANYLAHSGSRTVAAIYEDSYIGREYLSFFKDACRFEGLRVIAEEPISQISTDLSVTVARVKAAGADAIGYFGFGLPAVHINAELGAIGWDPLRVMTTAFLTAPFTPQGMKAMKGWAGVDQYDEANPVGQAVIDRFARRHGYRPENYMISYCYDLANLVAHAISKAHPISATGVRRGLERVKMLPAASGGADTFMSLAPHVRRAWLGAHYLVVRQATTDDDVTIFGNMGTTLVHRMTARTREQRAATRSGL